MNAPKATGRPAVNAGVMWRYFTTSVYRSGDLPVLATREALQNAADAIRAAQRARQIREGRFAVELDEAARTLAWEDNGVGMDLDTLLGRFLVLGNSGKREGGEQATGGFGVAKAVILGLSRSFRWELHTRDNLARSAGLEEEVQVFDAAFRQGTRLVVHDLDPSQLRRWDYGRQSWIGAAERVRELLAANDLPELVLSFNGAPVEPLFPRRRGSVLQLALTWGAGTEAQVKSYRRAPGDRRGGYWVRLNGLLQFHTPSAQGLKQDLVVDLRTTLRPGEPGYPLTAARDGLAGAAEHALNSLVRHAERESESVARDPQDEVWDPDEGGSELLGATRDALTDPSLRAALVEAAGGVLDFYRERTQGPGARREEPSESEAPAISPADPRPTRSQAPAQALTRLLEEADRARQAAGSGGVQVLGAEERAALVRLERGEDSPEDAETVAGAVQRAADHALGWGGAGLLQVVALQQATEQALPPRAPRPSWERIFGRAVGVRIHAKYDRRRARRFKQDPGRYLPHLTAWDATLRLVATEGGVQVRFRAGLVLDDEVLGLAAFSAAGVPVVYINPEKLAQVLRAHRERPLAVAAYLHGVACHELTHADHRMGQGHNEAFVVAREDLGAATAHLLPALALLVARLFTLSPPATEEARRLARCESALALHKARAAQLRRQGARADHLSAELAQARAQLAAARAQSARVRAACACRPEAPPMRPDTARARALVGRIFQALTAEPPPGVDRAYLDGFRQRAEPTLIRLLERRIAEARARKAAQPPKPDPEEDPAPAPIPPERWREGLRAVTAQGQHGALLRVVRMSYAEGPQGAPTVEVYADLRLDSGRKLSLGPRTPIYPERGPAPAVLPDPDLDGDGVFRSPEDAWQELRSRLSSLEHFEAKERHARTPQRRAEHAHQVLRQRERLTQGLGGLEGWLVEGPVEALGPHFDPRLMQRMRLEVFHPRTPAMQHELAWLRTQAEPWRGRVQPGQAVQALTFTPTGPHPVPGTLEAAEGDQAQVRAADGAVKRLPLWQVQPAFAADQPLVDAQEDRWLIDLAQELLTQPRAYPPRGALAAAVKRYLASQGVRVSTRVMPGGGTIELRPAQGSFSAADRARIGALLGPVRSFGSGLSFHAWERAGREADLQVDDYGRQPGARIPAPQVPAVAALLAEELARAGQPLTHRGQALVAGRAQALAERGGGGATPEQRAQAAAGCAEVHFRLPEHGDVRVVCGQAGRRDVWHNVFVGPRRYGFNGGRWARGEAPPPAVLAAVRERGITVFG